MKHIPVLLDAVMQALGNVDNKKIVDATFGAGGYSRAFLESGAHVIAFDRDPNVRADAEKMADEYGNKFTFIPKPFSNISDLSDTYDAFVFDLGISSMQIDIPKRGFSFRGNGPLDMRMSESGMSAMDLIKASSVEDLAQILRNFGDVKKAGILSIHDTTCHDSPSFSGSYKRSAETIEKNLAKYPSIQVTIDIHRDTIGNNERGKIKPTFKVGNRKAAQIMIMSGCDLDGSMEFPDWEYNLRFALRLQRSAETMYPGMTRSLFFGPVKYNMNKTHASLLIEVGTEVNTLNEAVYTGTLLGNVLENVFKGI